MSGIGDGMKEGLTDCYCGEEDDGFWGGIVRTEREA